ncbi:hypothetical protein ACSFA8_12845 [Variovorax sp. RT4R15]|uniref:hypothetical protein n=1 Tax=Variovorax sp. RT4R15 TaxID=3443737 RepID=UPI003F46E1BD
MKMARNRIALLLAALAFAAGLSGCGIFPSTPKPAEPDAAALPPAQEQAKAALPESARRISAQTPTVRAYRKTGARYIYTRYADRIYKGKIPPLVYAVATVETHIDAKGEVEAVTFMRAPSHAPEVSVQIVELIKKASPLPAPGRIGAHTYVETWLWDKSGKFQLDSLTEGQRSR